MQFCERRSRSTPLVDLSAIVSHGEDENQNKCEKPSDNEPKIMPHNDGAPIRIVEAVRMLIGEA